MHEDDTDITTRDPIAVVTPAAQRQINGLLDAWEGFVTFTRFIARQIGRLLGFTMSDPRRSLVLLGAVAAAVIAMFAAENREPAAIRPVLVDHFTYTVEAGDNASVIARRFKTTVDALVRDNLELFAAHAAKCQDRAVSAKYLKGELKQGGGKRRTEVCVVEKFDGREVALGTLRPADKLTIRCEPDTIVPECIERLASR